MPRMMKSVPSFVRFPFSSRGETVYWLGLLLIKKTIMYMQ
eukprot:Nitzschia sp. Nitz4//scaffold87_size112219//108806//109029//NITZ4_004094-RA/size112219-exonerate_est2genome-gene-0.50-mRNA-1//-1//CDS//3329559429//9004//frame0